MTADSPSPRNQPRTHVLLAALLACGALACAAHPALRALERDRLGDAVEAYRQAPELTVLRDIARHVLAVEAASEDEARSARAFTTLSALGPRTLAVLDALDARTEPSDPATAARVRGHALALRAELGDVRARRELRERFEGNVLDADARALAVSALELEPAQLLALASAAATGTRLAAVRKLPGRAPQAETLRVLRAIAHADPVPELRAAATHALGRARAYDAVLERLADQAPSVRLAAIAALLEADRARATEVLRARLGEAVTPESIEAARLLLTEHAALAMRRDAAAQDPAPAYLDAARSLLARALGSADAALRAHAATAVGSLHEPSLAPLLRERLRVEPLASTRLLLALALGRNDGAAHDALVQLTRGDGVTGAQAALELTRAGDASAAARLRALLSHDSASVRAVAAAGLAELGYVRDASRVLDDADPGVRVRTAAALLRVLDRG